MVKIILHKFNKTIKLLPYLLLIVLSSCRIVEDYKIKGETTFRGNIKHEINFHEHLLDSCGFNYCFYHHDTINEDFEITIDNIKKIKRFVWYKK